MAAIVPTLFSTEMAAMPPQTQNYTPVGPQSMNGKRRSSTFYIALAGNEVHDTAHIAACIIPKGARIMKSDIFIDGGPGANVTFNVGLVARDGSGVLDPNTAIETEGVAYQTDLYEGLSAAASLNDTEALLGNFAPANAAAAGNFADTIAHYVGYVTKKDCILLITPKVADVSVAKNIFGYVSYVLD